MASEEQHAAAILAALNAAGAAAYDVDDLTNLATLPSYYTEFGIAWRYGALQRAGRTGKCEGYRFTTRAVAKTVSNARVMQDRAETALQDRVLVIDGVPTTPIQRDSRDQIAPDEGWYSGLTTWTFVH
jgi:hypothetical protein